MSGQKILRNKKRPAAVLCRSVLAVAVMTAMVAAQAESVNGCIVGAKCWGTESTPALTGINDIEAGTVIENVLTAKPNGTTADNYPQGAVLLASGGVLNVDGTEEAKVTFSNNIVGIDETKGSTSDKTSAGGGAITILSGATGNISYAEFKDNMNSYEKKSWTGKYTGAGAIESQGTLNVSNSSFTKNTAFFVGGAVSGTGALNFNNNEFIKNGGHRDSSDEKYRTDSRGENIYIFYGGAVAVRGASASLQDTESRYIGNFASTAGGAITNHNGSVTGTNLYFEGNTAGSYGGAIDIDGGTTTIVGGTFKENVAKQGGAIALWSSSNSTLILKETVNFTENKTWKPSWWSAGSEQRGGAIRVMTGTATFAENSTIIFTGNDAGHKGGAIYNGAVVNGKGNAEFKLNSAQDGGAIFADEDSTNTFSGSNSVLNFVKNHAKSETEGSGNGGAIYSAAVYSSRSQSVKASTFDVAVKNVTFTENTASGSGGAIYNRTNFSLTASDSYKFDGNTAVSNGGALYNASVLNESTSAYEAGSVTLSGKGTFKNNKSDANGGAIYNAESASAVLSGDSIAFESNLAGVDGGALYLAKGNTFSLTGNHAFTDNEATKGSGGAVYNNELLVLEQTSGTSSVTGNEAGTNGGAFYNAADAGMIVTGSTHTYSGNEASGKGGAIYNEGYMALGGVNTFESNTDADGGNDIVNNDQLLLGAVGSTSDSDSDSTSQTVDYTSNGMTTNDVSLQTDDSGNNSSTSSLTGAEQAKAITVVHDTTTIGSGVRGTGDMYLNQGHLIIKENVQVEQGTFTAKSGTTTEVTVNSKHIVKDGHAADFSEVEASSITTAIANKGYSIHTTGGENSLTAEKGAILQVSGTEAKKTYLIAYSTDANGGSQKVDAGTGAWEGDVLIVPEDASREQKYHRVANDAENGYVMISSEFSDEGKEIVDNGSLGNTAYYGYLADLSDLRHRLGEVRYGAQDGAWAKVIYSKYRAKGLEGGNAKAKDYSIHVGVDNLVSRSEDRDWLLGASFKAGHTDTESARVKGDGNIDHYTLKGYATYMAKGGSYADLVGTVGYYDTDFSGLNNEKTGMMKGDYKTWGAGVSAEIGHMFSWGEDIDDRQWHNHWFFEPQAQLSYFWAKGKDFTTSTGINVSQDNADFLTGRLGVVLGKKFSYGNADSLDRRYGQVALRAGWIHEFKGDQVMYLNNSKATGKVADNVFYYGLDVDWNFARNQKVYFQVDRAEGSGYRKEFQVRLGYRYQF